MDRDVFGDIHTFYVFMVTDELYALDTNTIKGTKVGYQSCLRSVDNPIPSVVGFIEWGGESMPVIDLQLRFGDHKTPTKSQADMIIIVESDLYVERNKCGLLIDGYLDIANVKVRDFQSTRNWKPDIKQYFIINRLSDQKRLVKIIDITAMLAELRWLTEIS